MNFNEWVQSRLTAHGFPVGPIDGVIGSTTIAAIRAFEQAHGLTVDGTADETVVQALRAPASAVPPAVMVQIPNRDIAPQKETMQPSKTVWPRQSEVPSFYGTPGDMANMTQIEVPYDMFLAWDKAARVRKITLHKKVAPSALRVLQRISGMYSSAERETLGLHLFGGSLNVRKMRGGNSWSMHAWAIAIDFDPARNGLHVPKPQARLSQQDALPFWVEWETEGWLSLGRARNMDWMHVQAARL